MPGRYRFSDYLLGRPGPPLDARAQAHYEQHRRAIHGLTDRLFAPLMAIQFVVGLLLATGAVRPSGAGAPAPNALPLALLAGGPLAGLPILLAIRWPGRTATRHGVAAGQLGFSALFAALTAGHAVSGFHTFGSLALLAFYRDWRVFLTATAVVLGDQLGLPALGVVTTAVNAPGARLEMLAGIVATEMFLMGGCPRAEREMQDIARQRARLEETNAYIAEEVRLQTAALSASEQQYRTLFERHPLPMWVYDVETLTILNVNDAAVTTYGYGRDEFVGRSITSLAPSGMPWGPDAAGHRGPEAILTHHQPRDGGTLDVEVVENDFTFRDRPVRLLAAQDVTRRLRAERLIAVQQSVTRELAVSGSLADAARPVLNLVMRSLHWDLAVLWLVDGTGEHIEPLETLAAGKDLDALITGIQRQRLARGEGLAGRTWAEGRTLAVDDIHDPSLVQDMARLAQGLGLSTLLSVPVIGNDRVVGVLQFVSRDNRMNDLPLLRAVEAIARNIGQYVERKRLEQRLHLLADIVEASSDAIYALDLHARVLSWNRGARELYGFSAHEMLGHPVTCLAPEHRTAEVMEIIEQVAGGGTVENRELARQRKDGSLVQVQLSAAPIRDTAGHVVGLSVVARDISEAKRLQARLHQAQKLEAIGELAAGVAHEINTPTQYVGDNVQFLSRAFGELGGLVTAWERLVDDPDVALDPAARARFRAAREPVDLEFIRDEVPQAIAAAQDGVSRIGQIVGAMKEFSHPGTREKAPTDLNRAILSTITVARGEWKHHADVVTELDPDLPLVVCRADEINQVLLNLIVNAAHAIRDARRGPGKGSIGVTTRSLPGGVEIRVTDTGTGIPEEIRRRVYDPFFTTKGVGKGTGQGLAIAHDVVVVKHGGTIDFESEVGVGTTFVVTLPVGSIEMGVDGPAEAAA